MPAPIDPHDRPGRRLIGAATAFCRCAQLLHEHDEQSGAWAICFVNLGFAIELGLKGYLRETGGSEKEQRGLRHDLLAAFRLAQSRGFVPSHPAQEQLIVELNPHFKDMTLRYVEGTVIELPPIEAAIQVVWMLLRELHEQGGVADPEKT